MRNGILLIVASWAIWAAPVRAQTQMKLPDSAPTTATPTPLSTTPGMSDSNNGPGMIQPSFGLVQDFHCWVRMDQLLWWAKRSPLPVPLVTVGNPSDTSPGAIGQPGTRLLEGNENIRLGAFSGFRLVVGSWLDDRNLFGIEGVGFGIERRSNHTLITSQDVAPSLLAIPFFNANTNKEDAKVIFNSANAGTNFRAPPGFVQTIASLQLAGAEVNGVVCLWREPTLEVNGVTGFKYADLHERLAINTFSLLPPQPPATFVTTNDLFNTRNQFYGGQIGGQFRWQRNRCSLDTTACIAVGSTHQVVDIEGHTDHLNANGVSVASSYGGFYAQSTNTGVTRRDQLTFIPSVEVKGGYQCRPRLRFFVGYDFMYWNQVVRPGDQLDRRINLTQNTILGNGALSGPAAPTVLFNRADFWAQGMNFGMEFRF